ncbi:MAG: HEAT repeat domain-containing protein [Candidatus Wallbacteria bacterium]|nr:HEAT repeat domain-containing protein [Candidatus Wallbacteria bacterium]
MPSKIVSQNLSIMITDIQGFSNTTTSSSRSEIVDLIRRHKQLMVPVIEFYKGRIYKTMGDAFLCGFNSATDAVVCALIVQLVLKEFNDRLHDESKQMLIRVVINSGDVTIEENDVFGDAVNIAARMEALPCFPGGSIGISESTYLLMNRSEIVSEKIGPMELKGITEPVTVYQVPVAKQKLTSIPRHLLELIESVFDSKDANPETVKQWNESIRNFLGAKPESVSGPSKIQETPDKLKLKAVKSGTTHVEKTTHPPEVQKAVPEAKGGKKSFRDLKNEADPLQGLISDPFSGKKGKEGIAVKRVGNAEISQPHVAVKPPRTPNITRDQKPAQPKPAEAEPFGMQKLLFLLGLLSLSLCLIFFMVQYRNDPRLNLRLYSFGLISKNYATSRISAEFPFQNPDMRIFIIKSLIEIKADPKEVLLLIFSSLKDQAAQVADFAAKKLDDYLRNDPAAFSALLLLQKHRNPDLASQAAQKIRSIGADDLGKILSNSLNSQDPLVRAMALKAYAGRSDAQQVSRKFLSDADPQVRLAALDTCSGSDSSETTASALAECLADPDTEVRKAAVTALKHFISFPSSLAATLIKAVKSDDPQVRLLAVSALGTAGCNSSEVIASLKEAMSDPNKQINLQAIRSLQMLGNAQTSLPEMIKALSDKNQKISGSASETLASLLASEAAIPSLANCISDPDHSVRLYAANALGNFGKSALSAYPMLLDGLKNCESSDLKCFTDALSKIGSDEPGTIPYLTKALSENSQRLRLFVIDTLGHYGKAASDTAVQLTPLYADGSRELRGQILNTLGEIEPDFKISFSLISKALTDKDDSLRTQAEEVLKKLAVSTDALPLLLESLSHKDQTIRATAASTIGFSNQDLKPAIPLLTNCLADPIKTVKDNAAASLIRIGGPAVSYLGAKLQSSDNAEIKLVLEVLDRFGDQAGSAVQAIVPKLNDPDLEIRRLCLKILGNVQSGPECIPAVIQLLKDNDPEVCRLAIKALEKNGSTSAAAIPELTASLSSSDPYLRRLAIKALDSIDIDKKITGTTLIRALNGSDSYLREYADEALTRMDKNPQLAVAAYGIALHDSDPFVRTYAAKALSRFGSGSREFIPVLQEMAKSDESFTVRSAAQEALKTIK